VKALARFQDTWKCLQRETVNPDTQEEIIYACCILHNIVIEIEDDAAMLSVKWGENCKEVRQLANEDAVRSRPYKVRWRGLLRQIAEDIRLWATRSTEYKEDLIGWADQLMT